MKHKAENYLGWYGVLAIITAYLLVSFNIIATKNIFYLLMNLSGAAGIIVEALSKKDMQPAILNIIWGLIAAIAIIKVIV